MDPIPLRTSPTLNTFEQKRNQVAPVSRRFNRCILRSESCVAFADSNVDGTVDRSGSVREITMRNDGSYQPKAEHKFSFGLWTLDAHTYRTEDCCGVEDFARGCMRTYLILKEKAEQWKADQEIQAILQELSRDGKHLPYTQKFSKAGAAALLDHCFDKEAILRKHLPYERLDQLTVDILAGIR